MFRLFLMLVGATVLIVLALMVISPWWRRLVASVLGLFISRNSTVTPREESPRAPDEVIEGEFRVIKD